jgi:hypothetical protein
VIEEMATAAATEVAVVVGAATDETGMSAAITTGRGAGTIATATSDHGEGSAAGAGMSALVAGTGAETLSAATKVAAESAAESGMEVTGGRGSAGSAVAVRGERGTETPWTASMDGPALK